MKFRYLPASILLLFFVFGFTTNADAQKKKKSKKDDQTAPAAKKDDKSYKDIVSKCAKWDGLFTVYQDTTNGKTFLEINTSQFNQEYIYFSYIENGLLEAGSFRGNYRGSKVITFEKYYDQVEVYTENTSYYFDESSALSKASHANINRPLIISQKIEASLNAESIPYALFNGVTSNPKDYEVMAGADFYRSQYMAL